jgi:hypothetical protein
VHCGVLKNDGLWHECKDNIDDFTNDAAAGRPGDYTAGAGSVWPLVGNAITAYTGDPVAFVACANGTTTSAQWQPGVSHTDITTLYGWCVTEANAAGGVNAVLWHQGESDALASVSSGTYETNEQAIADGFYADITGHPSTIITLLQNCSGIGATPQANIKTAKQYDIAHDAHCLLGADLSDLTTDDSYHLTTNGHLSTWGAREAAAIETALGL